MNEHDVNGQLEIPTPVEPPKSAPIAVVRGEPFTQMPADLYIPPDALEVFFETFQGPLDLLLYLIRKANIDILDIPMAKLTAQYMEYVETMRKRNLELAAEYLVMAAMLMEIKSRMLLPRPKQTTDDERDPRAELVKRLLEYEQIKLAAAKLDTLPQLGRDFFSVSVLLEERLIDILPQVSPSDLEQVWRVLLSRARLTQHHRVTKDELSVREHMTIILRKLGTSTFAEFSSLFEVSKGVQVLVVNFLALLELVRERLVDVTQSEAFAPIYVKMANV